MTQNAQPWPPLIVAARQPAWIRWRDFALTMAMWLLLAAMLNQEFELFLGVYLEPLGLDALLHRLGVSDLDPKLEWLEFGRRLAPYLVVVFVLVTTLTTFTIHTLLRRRRSLGGASPRPLSLAREAREAALPPMVGSGARSMDIVDETIADASSVLAMLNGQDTAALVAARGLRIALVTVTADGHYRIERAAGSSLQEAAALA